jgi:indole-3-glycerol phosphate synthase
MLIKVQIYKALDVEFKKQKGPAVVKDPYKGHHSLKEELSQPGITIIAEVAGGNPLRGQVRETYRASTHAKSLMENGARAISVATDRFLFHGEDRHLSDVRSVVKAPLIRQDFILEEYQVEESKILGADAVVFMAALMDVERLVSLQKLARSKGLDVVVQVATEGDLRVALEAGADIICVLGRDLETWEPQWEEAIDLMKQVPERCLRIIEAGISTLEQIRQLEGLGVHGVIVGDALLDEFYPGKRLAQILSGVDAGKKPGKGKKALEEDVAEPARELEDEGSEPAAPKASRKAPKGGGSDEKRPSSRPAKAREASPEIEPAATESEAAAPKGGKAAKGSKPAAARKDPGSEPAAPKPGKGTKAAAAPTEAEPATPKAGKAGKAPAAPAEPEPAAPKAGKTGKAPAAPAEPEPATPKAGKTGKATAAPAEPDPATPKAGKAGKATAAPAESEPAAPKAGKAAKAPAAPAEPEPATPKAGKAGKATATAAPAESEPAAPKAGKGTAKAEAAPEAPALAGKAGSKGKAPKPATVTAPERAKGAEEMEPKEKAPKEKESKEKGSKEKEPKEKESKEKESKEKETKPAKQKESKASEPDSKKSKAKKKK